MYLPAHFREDRVEAMTELMAKHPLATLISLGSEGLIASHMPLLWDPKPGPLGTLRGHFARPNPHGGAASSVERSEVESLAIFVGPSAYVSPSWYASKRVHGKVVPTWNYVAVHAYGTLVTIDDPMRLREHVTRLTATHEASAAVPWQVSDAPDDFIDAMLRGIVGIEMRISRLEGKWKLSQNRSDEDRAGTIAGLEERGDAASRALAELMRAREPGR